MRKLAVSGLVLALLTGAAMAQGAVPPAPPAPPAAGTMAPPPPPPGDMGPGAMNPGAPPPPSPGGPDGHRPPPPPPPSRAAHFRLERGDTALDVKCADDEPMRACADVALQLLDKLAAMPKP